MRHMLDGEEVIGTLYKQNDVIFNQGENGDCVYLIQSGTISVYCDTRGERSKVCTLTKGDFLGEIALVNGQIKRCTTAQVLDDARLIRVSKSTLLNKIHADSEVTLHLFKNLLARLKQSRQRIYSQVMDDATLKKVLQKNCDAYFLDLHKFYSSLDCHCYLDDVDSCHVWIQTGQQIDTRDTLTNEIALITQGYAELCFMETEGLIPYSLIGPGDIVAHTSSLLENSDNDKIKAKTRLRIQTISSDDLVHKMRMEPLFSRYLLESVMSRLRFQSSALRTSDNEAIIIRNNRSTITPTQEKKILTIAIVSLSTCSGCSSTWLEKAFLDELCNEYEIVYCPFIMDRPDIPAADISLVDGVVRLNEDLEKLEIARRQSKYMVAWGTCACQGGIPAMANRFEVEELIEETYGWAQDTLAYYLDGKIGVNQASTYQQTSLRLHRKARGINEFVRVDYSLPGCPPPLNMLRELLQEIKGGESRKAKPLVCAECRKRKTSESAPLLESFPQGQKNGKACMVSQGTLCLGFMTRGGCNALCTKNNFPCWGCRGVSHKVSEKTLLGDTFRELLSKGLAKRMGAEENDLSCVLKTLQQLDYGLVNFKFENGPTKQQER